EYVYSGATPEQARAEELADKLGLAWSSSEPAVVMVDADGNLAAVGTGRFGGVRRSGNCRRGRGSFF
ncbi:hypothetical protein H6B10_14875, partial [Gemmiger formicilis]|uniref:hypothetical protein n=1 Tax=Gemmiger formicilis TaxID=745368 RepID=UPI00195A3B6F